MTIFLCTKMYAIKYKKYKEEAINCSNLEENKISSSKEA